LLNSAPALRITKPMIQRFILILPLLPFIFLARTIDPIVPLTHISILEHSEFFCNSSIH
jgi:hypothetical protein